MKDTVFFKRDNTITPEQASYYKDLLYRGIKIGTEIEVSPPKGVKRPVFEEAVKEDLHPSGTYEHLGETGVLDVKPEHCGIELRVIGRHPHYQAMFSQFSDIMSILRKHGARPRPICGMHFHLIPVGISEPIPEIILANLWNLVRRYAPALKFICSCGDKPERLCRRRNHNSHLELVKHSSGTTRMPVIQEMLKQSHIVPEHQNFMNLQHVWFDERGDVSRFHIEFRFPDVDLCPASIVAKIFLVLAISLKAVDLSQFGVIHVGKYSLWKRKKSLLDMLSNNEGYGGGSDTSQLTWEDIEEIKGYGWELLDLLGTVFSRFENNPSLDILYLLNETPISLMRTSGMSWEDINRLVNARSRASLNEFDNIDLRLIKIVELMEIDEMPDDKSWCWQVAKELRLTPQELQRRLRKLEKTRGMTWNHEKGTMVFRK